MHFADFYSNIQPFYSHLSQNMWFLAQKTVFYLLKRENFFSEEQKTPQKTLKTHSQRRGFCAFADKSPVPLRFCVGGEAVLDVNFANVLFHVLLFDSENERLKRSCIKRNEGIKIIALPVRRFVRREEYNDNQKSADKSPQLKHTRR